MRITQHTVIGVLAVIPVYNWSILGATAFFLASVVLDVDHFIFYSLQEKRFSFSPRKFLSGYGRWSYYGPRIHIFHNYELVVLSGAFAWIFEGVLLYLFAGVLLHLICDQADTYRSFRYMRVKTLIGDIFRYQTYLQARRQGGEKEYLIARRDSWRNHLMTNLSKARLKEAEYKCDILRIYPEIPIDTSGDSGTWKKIL